jgi:hypothetical protein
MADKIVTLIDHEGENLYPVAGALKEGSVTTSTIADDAITSSKIDFDGFVIPQQTGVELNTGAKFAGSDIYAQRFAGSYTFTAWEVVNIPLATNVDHAIKSIGWVKPGANFASAIIGTTVVGTTGSAFASNGGHYVMVTIENELRLRYVYANAGTMTYDIVVYYTKLNQ